MNRPFLSLLTLLVVLSVLTAGCGGWNPLGLPRHLEVETTSELGPETLARIDDLNEMLERGVEIGPETRAAIEELNETIRQGIRFGFTDDTLTRIDRLLSIVEQGVGIEVGLDPETNATVNHLIDTIDQAPDQWENAASQIIRTLEGSTSRVAGQMADEVRSVINEARLNTQYISATMGAEFRCNVDFLGARAGDTVNQFIGRTIIGRLRAIVSGQPEEPAIPVPWVCQIIPDQIDLARVEGRLVFETAVVKISGYNYVAANLPNAYIVDEAGQRVETVPLYPFLSSPYQIQLNLQSIDFSAIPERSRVVFEWPTAGTNYALAMVFPTEVVPTEVVQAQLTITASSVDVRVGPADTYRVIGRAEAGAVYLLTGRNGAGTWWQIDYDGEEGWVPASAGQRNEIDVPVVSIPLPPPTASFQMDVSSGDAPLEVHFVDRSSGGPIRWEWDFGEGAPSFEQNPSHVYQTPGTYQVRLRVENHLGSSVTSQTIVVTQPRVFIPFRPILMFPILPPRSAFSDGSILFSSFASLGHRVHHDTRIPTATYECGITSMAAMDGDIQENGPGDIIYAYMVEDGGTWWINANFRTHENHENWFVGVMCLKRDATDGYQFFRHLRVRPAERETINLRDLGIPDDWHCGVAGFAAWLGDINEYGAGEHIIKAFAQKNTHGEWELTANFRTHGTEEYWDIDLLCVYDDPAIFLHQSLYGREGERPIDTNVSSVDYACGIDGFAALNGDILENGAGPILRAYTYVGPNQHWFVMPDFRSHGMTEMWDIQLLCARRPIAQLSGDWSSTWVR